MLVCEIMCIELFGSITVTTFAHFKKASMLQLLSYMFAKNNTNMYQKRHKAPKGTEKVPINTVKYQEIP